MAKAKRAGNSYKGYYASYKTSSRWRTNRERRLKKLLALQPDNQEIATAIKNISYRRKNPTSTIWNKTNIRIAQLFKLFCGKAPHALFSSNAKTQSDALSIRMQVAFTPPPGKVDFSLGYRAHDKWGSLVWG